MDECGPGPGLDAGLAAARVLGDQELLDGLVAAEAQVRAGQAERAVLAVEVQRRIAALGYRVSGAADQVAVSLAISARSADRLVDTAVGVCDRPVVWTGLAAGRIDLVKAGHILDVLEQLPDPHRAELEAAAVGFGQSHTAYQLKRELLAMVCEADPDEALRAHAVDARGVWISARAHGMADVHAHLSLEHAEVSTRR